jgi:hypothetical protein
MDTSLLMLDWATLSRLFQTSMWSNVMNKPSHGLLGECRGPRPSWWPLDTSLGRSTSVHVAWCPLCLNPAQPVLQSSRRHNFIVQTLNWVNQTQFHVSRWALRHGAVKMSIWWSVFLHVCSLLAPTLT